MNWSDQIVGRLFTKCLRGTPIPLDQVFGLGHFMVTAGQIVQELDETVAALSEAYQHRVLAITGDENFRCLECGYVVDPQEPGRPGSHADGCGAGAVLERLAATRTRVEALVETRPSPELFSGIVRLPDEIDAERAMAVVVSCYPPKAPFDQYAGHALTRFWNWITTHGMNITP